MIDFFSFIVQLLFILFVLFLGYFILKFRTRELFESEERYRTISEDMPVLVCRFLPGGEITYVNAAYCSYFNLTSQVLIGSSFLSLIPEEEQAVVMERLSTLSLDAPTQSHEHKVIVSNGEICWQRWINRALFDEKGEIVAYQSIGEDITQRKQTEEALANQKIRLSHILQGMNVGIWEWNVQTGETVFNERWAEMLGYSLLELSPVSIDTWKQFLHSEDLKKAERLLNDCFEGRSDYYQCEYRLLHKNGDWVWILDRGKVVTWTDDGKPEWMYGTHQDITERKQAEETIRANEEKLRLMIDQSPLGVCINDLDGSFVLASPSYQKLTGYTEDELEKMTFFDITHPDDRPENRRLFEGMTFEKTVSFRMEKRYVRKDGSVIFVIVHAGPICDPSGTPLYGLALVEDITERKQAEEELKEAKVFLEAISDIAYVTDVRGNVTWVNAAVRKATGCEPEELIGKSFAPLFIEENQASLIDVYKRTLAGESLDNILTFTTGVTCHFTSLPRENSKGDIVGTFGVARDITAQKRAEEEKGKLENQLRQAQKMEAVGRLAGGVAHDFNNMLSVILGNAEMVLDQIGPDQPFFEDLIEIKNAADRSADLTRQLLAFARKQTISPKVLDLNKMVVGMSKMLQRLIGEDIDLAWMTYTEICPVKMDPGQVDQILANLCVNARDAISGVGKVTIETANTSFDDEYCANHSGFEPGQYVMLAVSDNGCGMDSETLANVFEPFFTTKELGKGTGLGLSTVYGAVRQNNGFVSVYSEPGLGTTFKIYLPRYHDEPVLSKEDDQDMLTGCGHETILLVEDEQAILRMTTMMLDREGYTVVAAGSPGQAMKLAHTYEGEIHMLMTDVIMPEMNGRELAKDIQGLYPGLKCLFMSGYTANVIAHHGVLDEGVNFIPKPFSKKELTFKVREVLESD